MTDKRFRKKKGAGKNIRISGLVIPSEWNDAGDVVGLCIKTFTEDEYQVSGDTANISLMKFIGKEVVVSGCVKKVAQKKYLSVIDFGQVLPEGGDKK